MPQGSDYPAFCYANSAVARSKVLQRVYEHVLRRPSLTILDVGCGNGWIWRDFVQHFPNLQLTGIDFDSNDITQANKDFAGYPHARFMVQDASATQKSRHQYDIVVSTDVLEHVRRRAEFFQQLHSALKPLGTALLAYGHSHFGVSLKEDLYNIASQILALAGNERYYTRPVEGEERDRLIQEAGLRIVTERWYNLKSLKAIDNDIPSIRKELHFLRRWQELEEIVNDLVADPTILERAFWSCYLELRPVVR